MLSAWFRSAAAFGADGVAVVLAVVTDRVEHASRALGAVATELRSPAALDWARRSGARDSDPLLRVAAVRILRAGTDPSDLIALRAAVLDADPLVDVAALRRVHAVVRETDELMRKTW